MASIISEDDLVKFGWIAKKIAKDGFYKDGKFKMNLHKGCDPYAKHKYIYNYEFVVDYVFGVYDIEYMTRNLVGKKIDEYQKNPTDLDLNHDMAVIIFYFIHHSKVWTNDSEMVTKYFKLCEKLLSDGSMKCKHQLAMIYIYVL